MWVYLSAETLPYTFSVSVGKVVSVGRVIQLVRLCVTFFAASFQGEFPSVEDMTVAERALHEMRTLIRLMQEEAAKAQEKKMKEQEQEEERRKRAELQAQQEAQKAAAQSAKEKAQRKGERIVLTQDRICCIAVTDLLIKH